MFWKFDLHTSSHIDTLLQRDDLALAELLDEEDVLQECKVLHPKLLDFLLRPAHLQALVDWVTREPPAAGDERLRYKYPSVSCEILTSDIPQINDALGEDEALLGRLYGFLQNRAPLNPLLASFFSKVMGILINRKTDQIVSFLRKKADFVPLLLHHIGTSAIMDLLLRLLTCVEQPPLRHEVFNWLNEERIVERLVDMIHPDRDDSQHSNASQSLCDIVRLSREQMIHIQDSAEPDQLLSTLEKQETIEHLLSNMFQGDQNESVIVNGIQVILTLLEPRRPRAEPGVGSFSCNVDGQLELVPPGGPESPPPSQANLGTLRALRQWLAHFHQLLLEPPTETLRTTWGSLQPPLGNTRLHVVKLLASALSANNAALTGELLGMDTLNAMLDLFFTYVFNNFLHSQVETWVSSVLSAAAAAGEDGPEPPAPNPAVRHLLQKCRLVERILGAWEENDRTQSEGGRRKGYMGHLTRIANAVVQSAEKGPNAALVGQLLRELLGEQQQLWEKFVSGPLSETNQKNMVDLVSPHNLHSSDDEDERPKGFSFPQEAVLQQAFMDFQMQQMTSAFVEHFGFNDEEFGEQEENVNAPFDKTASITFSLSADDDSPNASLFELCCKERLHQFDEDDEEGLGSGDSDGEDAIWQDGQWAQARSVRSGGSADSEEEDEEEEEEEEEEVEVNGTMEGLGPLSFNFSNPEPPGMPAQGPRKQILSDSVPISASVDSSLGPLASPGPSCGRAQDADTPFDRAKDPTPPITAGAPQESTEASVLACRHQGDQAARQTPATLSETHDLPRPSCRDSDLPVLPNGPALGGAPPSPNTK
ncbi:serine/threonine-protein phosphatase 6 regulatory subunit 1 isoform X2 [Trichosurus vulpecula]|uniref:serine/threonine-protein phosphatase 6 regulatory subunit 1 isoform X2 n=1 Tax=Trichosurus vulpecula TaxID=9337 RepID=UPI00186B2D62|nr:serine/threonine-protein phosphatase 6 regulatory subunit 1 isoform X2 [Trichosurus vulpecula]